MKNKFARLLVFILLFSFTTISGATWTSPVDVSNPADSVNTTKSPGIGVDAEGNAFAVWSSIESSQNLIKASRFDVITQTWSTPETIGSNSSTNPDIFVTPDGKVIAVWQNSTATIYSNFFDGSSWLGEQIIDTNITYQSQFYPKVTADEQGNAYAVWQVQGGNLARVIRSATFTFSSNTWAAATNISTDYGFGNAFVASPVISVNATGTAVSVWLYQDTGTSQYKVQSNRYLNGSWLPSGNEQNIITSNTDTVKFANPDVIVGPDGDALAIWPQYDGTASPIQPYTIQTSVRSHTTSTWNLPLTMSDLGNTDVGKVYVDLAVNASNTAIAVWTFQDDNLLPVLQVTQAAIFPNLIWSGVSDTLSDPATKSFFGTVAINIAGEAFVTWTKSNSTSYVIEAVQLDKATQTWKVPETISDSGLFNVGINLLSNISANSHGDFFIDWFRQDSITTRSTVQAAHIFIQIIPPIPPVKRPLPPRNFVGTIKKNQFLTQTTTFLNATWKKSHSPNVVLYRIYRNGKIVKEITSNSPLRFETLLNPKDLFTNYKVAAVDSDDLESVRVKLKIVDENK